MLKEANQILNTKLEITYLKTHLWRYSKCINPLSVEFLLLDNLAIIGDCMQPIAQLSLLESCIESAAQLSKHILPQQ
jgi:predicted NAD/FAD-dependent oxidoreductase